MPPLSALAMVCNTWVTSRSFSITPSTSEVSPSPIALAIQSCSWFVIVFITHRADAYCDFSGNAPLPGVERGVRRNLRAPALGVGLLRPAQFGGRAQFAQDFLRQLSQCHTRNRPAG